MCEITTFASCPNVEIVDYNKADGMSTFILTVGDAATVLFDTKELYMMATLSGNINSITVSTFE